MSSLYLCGVPTNECNGGQSQLAAGLGCGKSHSTHKEAFACKRAHLRSQGFVQVGAREFRDPRDGVILVLDKISHFGARLRRGKEGGRHMSGFRVGGFVW
jgi:hypothetical protein